MTPDRLRQCLGALNWSTAALAAMAQVSPVTARRWQAGKRPIPEQVGAAIEATVRAVEQLSSKLSDLPIQSGHVPSREELQACQRAAREVVADQLFGKTRKQAGAAFGRKCMEAGAIIEELQGPRVRDILAFHELIGSSVPEGSTRHNDFAGFSLQDVMHVIQRHMLDRGQAGPDDLENRLRALARAL